MEVFCTERPGWRGLRGPQSKTQSQQEADKIKENTAATFSKRQWKVTTSSGREGTQGVLVISPGGDTPHLASWGKGVSIREQDGEKEG